MFCPNHYPTRSPDIPPLNLCLKTNGLFERSTLWMNILCKPFGQLEETVYEQCHGSERKV